MSWQPADSQNAVRTADQRAPGPAGSAVQEAGDARQVARAVVAGQRAGRGKESGPKMAENSDRGTTLPVVSRSRARLRNLNSAGLGELTCRRTHTMRKKKEKGEKKPKKKISKKSAAGFEPALGGTENRTTRERGTELRTWRAGVWTGFFWLFLAGISILHL